MSVLFNKRGVELVPSATSVSPLYRGRLLLIMIVYFSQILGSDRHILGTWLHKGMVDISKINTLNISPFP